MTPRSLRIDHYELDTKLGETLRPLSTDSTGSTYRGRDVRTGKPVLLRLLSEQLLANEAIQHEFVANARFLIERDLNRFTRILDTGHDGNRFYYAMETAGGMTVEELVSSQGPLDPEWTVQRFRELVEALMQVHGRPGMSARVWPRNILISGAGAEATMTVVAQNLIRMVEGGEQPEYRAPEVLGGGEETEASSIYSMGATLYYLLSGQAPYPSGLPENGLRDLKGSQPPKLSLLPGGRLPQVIGRAVDPRPEGRPTSFREWAESLQSALEPEEASSVSLESPRSAEAEMPPQPSPGIQAAVVADPAPVGEGAGAPWHPRLGEVSRELEEAREHTQRLSLELTKRVRKELELKEQVQRLEAELEEERVKVRELAARQESGEAPMASEALEVERAKLEAAWVELNAARQTMERKRADYLKDTQRFSISQLKEQAEASKPLRKKMTVAGAPKPVPPPKKAKTLTPQAELKPPAAAPLSTEILPLKADASTQAAPESLPKAAPILKATPPKEVTSPGEAPSPQTDSVPVEGTTLEKAGAKAEKTAVGGAPGAVPATTLKRAPWAGGVTEAPKLSPKDAPEPVAGKGVTDPPATAESAPETAPQEAAPDVPQVYEKPEVPELVFKPVPGAWVALAVLGGTIGFGLFLVYRTFFRMPDGETWWSRPNETPTVIELVPFEEEGESEIGGEGGGEDFSASMEPAAGDRETALNEDLRVEMHALQNYTLLQQGKWEELLESLRSEEGEDAFTAAERDRIRKELWSDIQRRLELNGDEGLMEEAGFRELYRYLESSLNVVGDASSATGPEE